ncbi:nicotinamide-nucleotide amidase [Candidatus Planktophila versatilis]|jgi:nicotinamide-nucleotide amidase|uniref:CinA family protein n=1 Tax=Candidatus Planktophila versatilis TaxID=1884905 RepID=UPI000BAC58CC|nr:CinA family protein [Candidatus Planktophila versatilis]ASY18736.1 nicotinamide-nucleotide amidase [Candidatus Planktophila versatilis]
MASQSPAQSIIETLTSRGQTLAVAESLTGGGLGFALTQVPGASAVFLGGIISYTTDVKVRELGVGQSVIDQYKVVSEEVAIEMAEGAKNKFATTWAISTTGVAGPGDYQGVREGTVWIAIRGPINQSLTLTLDGGRDGVRQGAISSAIGTFARILSA